MGLQNPQKGFFVFPLLAINPSTVGGYISSINAVSGKESNIMALCFALSHRICLLILDTGLEPQIQLSKKK